MINQKERPTLAQWGCLVMLLGAIILTIVGAVWLFTKPAASPDGPNPTASVQTTTPTPFSTPFPTATTASAAIAPGEIGVGVRIVVSGTSNVGLSIRASAGVNAERVTVAQEGERLLVVGGPREADDYTWWFVRDELDPAREGWAAQNFMVPVN
jgi:hypothetical protein